MSNKFSAYGHTWPLVLTPQLTAQIVIKLPVILSLDLEVQVFSLETLLRKKLLPYKIEIQIKETHDLKLSPEDQKEHDGLARAAAVREK